MNNDVNNTRSPLKIVFLLGGIASFLLFIYSLSTMILMFTLGPAPTTAKDCFELLISNKLLGLLRLDILTTFSMPLYFILFYGIYSVLKNENKELLRICILLIFIGLTLFLATPSGLSMSFLSDRYAIALNDLDRNNLISAGEAIIASDMWHGSGAVIGGILIQLGALFVSIIMLKKKAFSKLVAIIGIVMFGLDLLHIILSFFATGASFILLAIAGPLYLIWFPLIGFYLMGLSKKATITTK